MGLYFALEKCEKCGSRNAGMISPHKYKCEDCGCEWEDTIAVAHRVFTKFIEKHSVILASQLPRKFC